MFQGEKKLFSRLVDENILKFTAMLLTNFGFFLFYWLLLSSKPQNISGAQRMSHPTNNFCILYRPLAGTSACSNNRGDGFCPPCGVPGTDPQGYTCDTALLL